MTQQHPITMPPELVKELWDKFRKTPINRVDEAIAWEQAIAQAVQWATDQANANIERKLQEAADQELEACLNCVNKWGSSNNSFADALRAARRPKPPSLKEEALAALGPEPLPETGPMGDTILNKGKIERHRIIHRALKALPDD